ncbi:MAG: hypothetical protein CMJ53_04465, partial [Planctomycetaceae bacterium]|nr:hypothetical protein [Planctomycetaceae bacterium]
MSNDHQRLNELFNQAVNLPESERSGFLAKACGADTDLRRTVEEMLAHDPGVTQTMAATHPDSGPPEPGTPEPAGPSVFSPGDTVDKYTITRRVAPKFGAMGEVYEATETGLDEERRVALKVPCSSKKDDPRTLEMFTAEKQTLSRMQHPGIPKVYNVGTTEDGIPYLAMEFIDGEHLLDYCNRTCMTIPKRLELFAMICDIMRHAHLKLEAHSDLKPANILVCEEHGEPRPMVIDFGVSKPSQDPSASGRDEMPNGGTLGFTHVYASPEQLSGQGTETASDIYSLGVILYELLVGKRPFDEARLQQEFKELVANAEPITPSTRVTQLAPQDKSDIARDRGTPLASLASTLRSELEWIPLKALRKKPEDRYESASAFGKDIRRYLNHEALEAGPESQLYRQRKWLRRHRFSVGASAAVAIALIAGIVASILFAVEATNAQADAERQKESAQRQSYMANFTLAKIYEEDADSPRVLESLEDCQKALQTPSSSSMPFEWQHLRAKLDDSILTSTFGFDLNEFESNWETHDAIAFHP